MNFVDFSERAADVSRQISYRELWPGSVRMPTPPAFMFGAVPADINHMMFAACHAAPIGLWSLRNSVVTRDHIVLHDRHVLTGAATNHPDHHCRAVMGGMEFDPYTRLRSIGGRVISLGGPGWNTWGHWLTDFLPRLYLFRAEGWELSHLRWLLPADTPAYAFEFLRMLGIGSGSILLFDERTECVAPGELIVAENFGAGAVMHPVYAEAVQWIRQHLASWYRVEPGPPRVYLSRRSTPAWRRLVNRDEVEGIAQRHGYEIVDPATLTAQAQVALLSGASHVAGEYGSALHSSIFAGRGTVVTCLRGATISAGVLQNGISSACGQPVGYVFGDLIPGDSHLAFTLSPAYVEAGLATAEHLRRV